MRETERLEREERPRVSENERLCVVYENYTVLDLADVKLKKKKHHGTLSFRSKVLLKNFAVLHL